MPISWPRFRTRDEQHKFIVVQHPMPAPHARSLSTLHYNFHFLSLNLLQLCDVYRTSTGMAPKTTAQRSYEYRQRQKSAGEEEFKIKKAQEMREYRKRKSQRMTEKEKKARTEYERKKKRKQRAEIKRLTMRTSFPYASTSSLGKAIAKVKKNFSSKSSEIKSCD